MFSFNKAAIKGISVAVPENEVSLLDDPLLYGGDTRRINRVIQSSGFLKRRVADDDVLTSDMCFQAALDLLKNLDIDNDTIDALLFVSYTPDYLMPATSYVLHQKLQLSRDCIVMDIPQACSGYVLGLFQASMLINAGCKRVLLLVGDTFSKFSDMFINHTAPVFGDAGSATLVEWDEHAETSYYTICSDGSGHDALMCKNGGFRHRLAEQSFYGDGTPRYEAVMDGGRIFDFTLAEVAPSIQAMLNELQLTEADFDWFVMHQANKFILENIARLIGVDISKVPMTTIPQYGNVCGASIPCVLADALKAPLSQRRNRLLLSGFGAGLSWANAVISTNTIYCSNVNTYKNTNR